MKKVIIFILLLIGIFCIPVVNAEDFYIKNYDVNINVEENKTVSILETIDTYFTNKRHGIIRIIPLDNYIVRQNGTSERLKAKVSNVYVNEQYIKTLAGGNLNIRIGKEDELVLGDKQYVIKYNYAIPKSKTLKNNDEFYFNIIGTEWDTNIDKVHFRIVMPKNFDTSKLGFSVGERGVYGFNPDKLKYSVNNNIIEGSLSTPLHIGEGVNIRLELPNDYFDYSKQGNTAFFNISVVLIIIFTLFSYFIWFMFGKDEPVIPVVNFYPPESLNSAQVGTMFREKADRKDIVSLIIYLAGKGYIKIKDNKNDYALFKIKNYDGTNVFERKLMYALFGNDRTSTTIFELENSCEYFNKCEEIMSGLSKYLKKLYEPDSISIMKKLMSFFGSIVCTIVGIFSLVNYDLDFFVSDNAFLILFPIIAIFVFIGIIKQNLVFAIIWCLVFGGIPLISLYSEITLNFDTLGLISLIGLIINLTCLYNMPKKNKQALRLLGNIAGFKNFIQAAEKHRIEMLAKENPSYCFNILPYAYILGVSDVFIKNFEKLIHSEYWIGGITINNFDNFSKSVYNSTKPSVENGGIKQSSGGSGYSGGGFSGGGFSGGGGRSW